MLDFNELLAWVGANESLLWWLGIASAITFIGSLIIIPYLVVRIPADYFTRPKDTKPKRQHPVVWLFGSIVKNFFGILFVLAGIAMLILPGQGILTILIGLMLINFPGKHNLERRIIQQPAVLRAINWMRAKADHPPLQVP